MQTDIAPFLATLHRHGDYSYWWTLEGHQSFWWQAQQPAPLPGGKRNIYFGVHPSLTIPQTDRHGKPVESRSVRSQINSIASVSCLFAEYDAKDFESKDAALEHVKQLDPRPSVVVDSGGGYHCYWMFRDSVVIDTPGQRETMRKMQAAWVVLMGGDTSAKDLARVLRVPGTYNYKYDPPRPVVFVWCDLDCLFDSSALFALAAPFIETTPTKQASNGSVSTDQKLQEAASRWLGNAVARVRAAPDGRKHKTLLAAAVALGGLVPIHLLTETEILSTLYAAIEGRAEDGKNAQDTIKDGIGYGIAKPWSIEDVYKSNGKAPIPSDTAMGEIVGQHEAPFAKSSQGVTRSTITDWRHHGITLAELQHKEFQPERWIVESILPEGACLLAAKYKSKKSWLALGLGLAVAMNGRALGRLAVSQGRVLYLDLEGKQQRIQKRTRAMLGIKQVDWPDNFHVFTRWPQGDEGLKETEQWFSSYPDTALVVADVLADYRRPIEKHEQPYQYDRTTVQPFNELCERYHAAGILVHHLNKAKNDDIMDGISGTTGLPSAVNSMWGLSKDVNDSNITILHLRGRDYENEEPLALRWDHYMTMHVIEGSAHEVATSAERKAVYQFLEDDQPRTPKEIAEACNKPVESVKQLLRKMLNDGQIDKMGYGKYALLRGRRKFDE